MAPTTTTKQAGLDPAARIGMRLAGLCIAGIRARHNDNPYRQGYRTGQDQADLEAALHALGVRPRQAHAIMRHVRHHTDHLTVG